MKSPTSDALRRVQKTLREALRQSNYVIFDSRRMKGLPDAAIERELRRKWVEDLRHLKGLILVKRGGVVVVIKP